MAEPTRWVQRFERSAAIERLERLEEGIFSKEYVIAYTASIYALPPQRLAVGIFHYVAPEKSSICPDHQFCCMFLICSIKNFSIFLCPNYAALQPYKEHPVGLGIRLATYC